MKQGTQTKIEEARTWYRDTAKKFRFRNETGQFSKFDTKHFLDGDKVTKTDVILPGRMYMFFYDPKHKKTLPYYDSVPLIFPIEKYKDGFLGINLHYLHPTLRAKLMDALMTYANNTKFDDSTKLNISYKILKGASRTKYFKPCVKRYL